MHISPLHRHLLRTLHGFAARHRPATAEMILALMPVDRDAAVEAIHALVREGLVVGDLEDAPLRLTLEGLAHALAPVAMAFERRRSPRGGVRKALRSVA